MRSLFVIALASLSFQSLAFARICPIAYDDVPAFFSNSRFVIKPSESGKMKLVYDLEKKEYVDITNAIQSQLYRKKADVISGDRAIVYYEETASDGSAAEVREKFEFEIVDLKTASVLYSSGRTVLGNLAINPLKKFRTRKMDFYYDDDARFFDPAHVSARFFDPERKRLATIYANSELQIMNLENFHRVEGTHLAGVLHLDQGEWLEKLSTRDLTKTRVELTVTIASQYGNYSREGKGMAGKRREVVLTFDFATNELKRISGPHAVEN